MITPQKSRFSAAQIADKVAKNMFFRPFGLSAENQFVDFHVYFSHHLLSQGCRLSVK